MTKKIALMALAATVAFGADDDEKNRLAEATMVLSEMTGMNDKGIPRDLIDKSECIIVIPSLKQGGFIFGGKYGRGFMSCRNSSGKGWHSPAAIRTEGGSFGLLIGAQAADVIMVVKSRKGAEKLMASEFTLGGEAAAAAGPVGRSSTAMTDAQMSAEILSWSRSRGVYGGLSLTGATIREDQEGNKALYGKEMTSKAVLTSNVSSMESKPFTSLLTKISPSRKS